MSEKTCLLSSDGFSRKVVNALFTLLITSWETTELFSSKSISKFSCGWNNLSVIFNKTLKGIRCLYKLAFSDPSCVATSSSVGALVVYAAVILSCASKGSPFQVIVLPFRNVKSFFTGPKLNE